MAARPETRTILTQSEAETIAAGRALAQRLVAGDIVLLSGELGAGKTAFVRGIADGLGVDPVEVSSPTFTLIQEYHGGRLLLRHVDLYRVQPAEVDELGLDELTQGAVVTAIEWPDRLEGRLNGTIAVRLEHLEEGTRGIRIEQQPPNGSIAG